MLRAVSGLSPPSSGTVSFRGRDITRMAPHRIAELGITQVPGGRGVFPSLTVAENLRMGAWLHRRDHAYVRSATAEVLELFPQLAAAAALTGCNPVGRAAADAHRSPWPSSPSRGC